MESTLDMKSLLTLFRRHIVGIAIVSLLCMAVSAVYTSFFVKKLYTSSVLLYCSSEASQVTAASSSASKTEAARKIAETYIIVLESKPALERVAENMGASYGTVASALSFSQQNSTEIIKVTATTTNPEQSAAICNSVAAVADSVLQEIVGAGSVRPIGKAEVPTSPSSPSVTRNAILALLVGLVLSCGFVIVRHLLDNTVDVEDDLTAKLGVPVLGEIPTISDAVIENAKRGKKA